MRSLYAGLLLSTLLGYTSVATAQLTRSISFQGFLTNSSGVPIDGSQDIVARLYTASVGGTQLWTRTYTDVNVVDGVFGIALEAGSPSLNEVSFDGARWLEIVVDGETTGPRTQLRGAPFAMGLSLPIESTANVGQAGKAALKVTNSDAAGTTYGIHGISNSVSGRGVFGRATASSEFFHNYGVYGESDSHLGTGIFGKATDADGPTYGVYGESSSSTGTGVHGTGGQNGVSGSVNTATGSAVLGIANLTTGTSRGVFGINLSEDGSGVYGDARATQGINVGVRGNTDSPTGWAGFFTGGRGVYARSTSNGTADLVLAANSESSDDGRIVSDPLYASSDIWIQSNDAVEIQLDADNDAEDADFDILDRFGTVIFNVDNDGTVTADGVVVHSSDLNRKENIVAVDPAGILEKVADLPIHTWQFIGQPETHIGPMAQDFYAAFGHGSDDKHIAGVDADGVALAAIQALYEIVMRQQEEIRRLELR